MKHITQIIALLFLTALPFSSMADNDRIIQIHQLPANAQKFIKKHFTELKPSLIKQDNDLFDKSYTVIFNNGTKIEFGKNGTWKEIDCKNSSIPQEVIPAIISSFIKEHYPNAKVVEMDIDDDSKKYDVELDNGITLKFNKHQQLIDIDD